MLYVCPEDLVSTIVDNIPETEDAEAKILFSVKPGEKSKITSVKDKKNIVTGFIGSRKYTVCSEEVESEFSILIRSKLASVLLN